MKKLIVIIIGLFCTTSAFADCTGTGFWVFPSGQTIKQNPIFVLDGHAKSENVILNLNKKYKVYLKCGDKKINLLVTQVCVGQFELTQAVLKPESPLEVGLEYTMCIDNLPESEDPSGGFNRYNPKIKDFEPIKYKVIAGVDTEKPIILSKPKEIKKTLVYYGCGPSMHAVFDNPAKDSSEIIVKTTVKDLRTGNETTYYIIPNGDKIKVGHGMCSGAFNFDEKSENYEIEFSFMDSSGNLTAWAGERIKFTKPTQETRHKDE